MARKIKVHKTLGKANVLSKAERNDNVANQLLLHLVLITPPHESPDYLLKNKAVKDEYTLHLTGDKEATIRMYAAEKVMDTYYYDTAEYVEIIANKEDDASLPVSVGFEVYAERRAPASKEFKIRNGNVMGEIFLTYPSVVNAVGYRAEYAVVVEDAEPVFKHAGACGKLFMVCKNIPKDTKILVRYNAIFSDGEGESMCCEGILY